MSWQTSDHYPRFRLLVSDANRLLADFAEDVRSGLATTPKRLSCRFFYDAEGSRLFEEISELPEYYLTRAEREILHRFAEEVVGLVPEPVSLIELGSGSATKTEIMIETLGRRQRPVRYIPVDISPTALTESARNLLGKYPWLEIIAIAGDYEYGLDQLSVLGASPKLILWLGSNIGNLERREAAGFLRRIRAVMKADDRLLIGVDLRKDRAILERAYNDSRGVTARFNLNLLARINRELGGQFDLTAFRHEAIYDETLGRIEMHLRSVRLQIVTIERLGLSVSFEAGERIHTENSYKYSPEEIEALVKAAGLKILGQWFDQAHRFSDVLCGRDDPTDSVTERPSGRAETPS